MSVRESEMTLNWREGSMGRLELLYPMLSAVKYSFLIHWQQVRTVAYGVSIC